MKKNNQPALILTFLDVLGLFTLAGAIIWLGLKMQSNGPTDSIAPAASANPSSPEVPEKSGDIAQKLNGIVLENHRNVDYRKLRDNLQQKTGK